MHFYNIDHFPDLPMEFVTPALTTQFFDPKPEDNYTKIRASMAPSDFKHTKFAQDFASEFGSIRCGYMRFEPMSFYDWHTDINRKHSINFLVTDIPNILTMFRTPTPIRMIYDIVNVDPKFRRPVLLDTTVEHCVVNYNPTQMRCILGLCAEDESVTFDDVQQFVANYKATDDMFTII